MIGRDEGGDRGDGLNPPLETGEAFKLGDEDEITWYPNWEASVSNPINQKFVDALVKILIDNEQVCGSNCFLSTVN
jgi:hypothetical protein